MAGQSITFTAKVTSQYGTIPDGELVRFYDGASANGTGSTASGLATFGTSSLAPGPHTITGTYVGDSTFSPSSGTVGQGVKKYPTSTTLSSSLNPSTYGQSVTWTATVTTSGPVKPRGTVGFTWGYLIGTGTLNASGVATLTRFNLNADPYPLTAVYGG